MEESPLIISPSVNPLVPETTRISFSTSQVSTFPDTSYPSLDFEVTVSPTKYSLEDKSTLNDGKYFLGIILAAAELNGLYVPGYSAPTSSSAKL